MSVPVTGDPIRDLITAVCVERLRRDLFHLSKDPLPYRKLNYTRPGADRSSLEEVDEFLADELAACGYTVEREGCPVQAFRCDPSKPKAHQYAPPLPEDRWYMACNLYAERRGRDCPARILLALAHKDSQSWVDSPGANDNADGTVALLEIARVLSDFPARHTIRFLFCNEEHRPWTSVTAAQKACERGDDLAAILNLDGMTGRSAEDAAAGRHPLVSVYTQPEGEALAHLVGEVIERYGIALEHRIARRERPGDDDGSFVNAGFPAAIVNIGSWPYAEPNYHTEADAPETVDITHLRLATQAALASIATLDLQ